MSNVTVSPLSTALGAQISGVDITRPLSPNSATPLNRRCLPTRCCSFATSRSPRNNRHDSRRISVTCTSIRSTPTCRNNPKYWCSTPPSPTCADNAVWHTDVTFLPTPALGAVLSAKLLPAYGGDTLWASGIAAYEALSAPMKRLLDGSTATHDFIQSFPLERFGNSAEDLARWEAARQKEPAICPIRWYARTPVSGRKSLFVSDGFTTRINELEAAESEAILKLLFAHATRPEFTLRWRWQANDVAFWDNRVTQHYAVDDYRPQRRVMHRATILGMCRSKPHSTSNVGGACPSYMTESYQIIQRSIGFSTG